MTSLFSIENWNVRDPNDGVPLNQIASVASRAYSLTARNRAAPRLAYGFVHINGAVEMMAGMEYHYENFQRLCRRIARNGAQTDGGRELRHEMVGYLNRIGQFHAFAKSALAQEIGVVPTRDLPTISRLIVFRNKHTAHRSIDAPQGETDGEKYRHATTLSTLGGALLTPKLGTRLMQGPTPGKPFDVVRHTRSLYRRNDVCFQIANRGQVVNFTPVQDHPAIMAETYRVVERLLQ
ncbi:MAG: hypothetical protein WDM85_10090 [Caulobacteraceae bacterium]